MLFGKIGITEAVAFAALLTPAPVALADKPNSLPVVDLGCELYLAAEYNVRR